MSSWREAQILQTGARLQVPLLRPTGGGAPDRRELVSERIADPLVVSEATARPWHPPIRQRGSTSQRVPPLGKRPPIRCPRPVVLRDNNFLPSLGGGAAAPA